MLIDNISFLKKVILFLANQSYEQEFIDTGMEPVSIGKDCDWETKEEWMRDTIEQWFLDTQEHFKAVGNIEPEDIVQPVSIVDTNPILKGFYDLEIGEQYDVDNFNHILRVPGGWIYSNASGSAFVPFVEQEK